MAMNTCAAASLDKIIADSGYTCYTDQLMRVIFPLKRDAIRKQAAAGRGDGALIRNLHISRARCVVECTFASIYTYWRAVGEPQRAGGDRLKVGQRSYVAALLTNRIWRLRDSYPRGHAWLRGQHEPWELANLDITNLTPQDDVAAATSRRRAMRLAEALRAKELVEYLAREEESQCV